MLNKLCWKIGGEAGYGIMTAGYLFAKICQRHGLNIFGTDDYPSLIRGGHNSFTIRAEDSEIFSHLKYYDLLVCLDDDTIKEDSALLRSHGVMIIDSAIDTKGMDLRSDVSIIRVPLIEIARKFGQEKIMSNTVGIGASAALLDFDIDTCINALESIFGKKDEKIIEANISAFKAGYNFVKENFKIDFDTKVSKQDYSRNYLIDGNTAFCLGAIRAGCNFISAYPMTPTTSILHYMFANAEKYKLVAHQAEDEIAAINNALGASFAGARAMTATSGGGFALMNEGLSLAGMSETPIVIVLGQRPGPATGFPTRTEQGELLYAVFAGHGSFPKIVLAPGSIEECYELGKISFNLAERYQCPVILILDKYLSSGGKTVTDLNLEYNYDRGPLESDLPPLEERGKFKRYAFTQGVSPRVFPGVKNGMHVCVGDEHDECGYIIEDSETRRKMMDKRMNKLNLVREELKNKSINVFGSVESSDITLLTWGSSTCVARQAAKFLDNEKINSSVIQVKVMNPFPSSELSLLLHKAKRVILLENNFSGDLGKLVHQNTCIEIKNKLLRYDGRPHDPEDVLNACKEIIK